MSCAKPTAAESADGVSSARTSSLCSIAAISSPSAIPISNAATTPRAVSNVRGEPVGSLAR